MAVARPSLLLAAVATAAVVRAIAAADTTAPTAAGAAATVLRAPGSLRAAPEPRAGTVLLTWRDRSRGERSHELRTSPATRTRRLPAAARRTRLRGLRPGRSYRALVRACAGRPRRCGRPAAVRFVAPPAMTGTVPRVAGCPVFPPANAWNRDVSRDEVDPRSDAYVRSIGLDDTLHADFGSGRYGDYGIPLTVVPAGQARVPIRFTAYGDESDPGPYPIPRDARIEGGDAGAGDRHVLVVEQGTCRLYELFRAFREPGGGWAADAAAVFDLRAPRDRPAGWTSADAAGLPILPGLARADEATAGAIHHALRFTVRRTQRAYVAPARHFASSSTDPSLPPMGLRLRLKASFDRAPFTGQARAILDALARHGMIVADNGSDWYISGTPDARWDDDDLDQLQTVPGRAFEVVRSGPLVRTAG